MMDEKVPDKFNTITGQRLLKLLDRFYEIAVFVVLCQDEYQSIPELTKLSGLKGSTVRRHVLNFKSDHFLDEIGRNHKKYRLSTYTKEGFKELTAPFAEKQRKDWGRESKRILNFLDDCEKEIRRPIKR